MRNKLKEFIVKHGLAIPYLHNQTGISKITLRKLIKTNAPIKNCVLLKLEAKLVGIGFSRLDLETFARLLGRDFLTNCEDGNVFRAESRYGNDSATFKLNDIVSINYSPTDDNYLFCEVIFKNGVRIIFMGKFISVFV